MVFLVQRTMWWLLEMKYGLLRRLSGAPKTISPSVWMASLRVFPRAAYVVVA